MSNMSSNNIGILAVAEITVTRPQKVGMIDAGAFITTALLQHYGS